jgi:hypothetical protein
MFLSILHDLVSLATVHLRIATWLIGRVYAWEVEAGYSLWNLFRGESVITYEGNGTGLIDGMSVLGRFGRQTLEHLATSSGFLRLRYGSTLPGYTVIHRNDLPTPNHCDLLSILFPRKYSPGLLCPYLILTADRDDQ